MWSFPVNHTFSHNFYQFTCISLSEQRILVKFLNRHLTGTSTPVIWHKVNQILCQKGSTLIHNQVQWNNLILCHIWSIYDTSDLKEPNFSGVRYNWFRMLQLINLYRALMVVKRLFWHRSTQSCSLIVMFRSKSHFILDLFRPGFGLRLSGPGCCVSVCEQSVWHTHIIIVFTHCCTVEPFVHEAPGLLWDCNDQVNF